MFWAVPVVTLLCGFLILPVLGQSSPCPSVYNYAFADGRISGEIQIADFSYGEHLLKVSMSLKSQLTSAYKGSLELLRQDDLLRTITSGSNVFYRVNFPLQHPLPKITDITFDGNSICRGPEEMLDGPGQYITSIILQHTVKATLVENPISVNGGVVENVTQNVRPPFRMPFFDKFNAVFFSPTAAPTSPQPQRTQRPQMHQIPQRPQVHQIPQRPPPGPAEVDRDRRCGLPQLQTNALVVGGDTTERGDWPWLATVNLRRNFQYICSGSLVSQNIVVTAGHCMSLPRGETRNGRDLIIQLGVYDRINYDEEDVETRNVRNVEFPPGRNASDRLFRDITVLVLEKPVTFNRFIIPVCLWSGNTDLRNIVGKSGSVVGWGRDENGNPSTPDPRLLEVPVVTQEMCKASSPEFQFIEDPNDFCAGRRDGVSAPCNGDSGAGMYFWRPERRHWELRGVVSFSLRDRETHVCDLKHYVVYTDAAKFRRWIEYHIDNN